MTSKSDWEEALKDQDAIVHYAAETGTGQWMYEVEKYVDVNINGTALMLNLLVNGSYNVKSWCCIISFDLLVKVNTSAKS